jgi:DNA repair protein SbcC/Rad50
MRPHLLEISAFGPFPGTVSVDLDDLGAGGLLLLHGETGAGKTSVLDALGYALYGAVPGDRGIRGLRSEHAGGFDETWVRLTFSAGGRRLRIRRTPEQSVAKQRGAGSTTRRASVLLEEVAADGTAVALATRLDEAGMMIADVVGMTAPQFFQVVLLPQGRFAEFLHAPAAERQVLLQQLFSTERFADVENALKRRRDVLRDELEVLSRDRDAALSVLGHVSLTLPDLVPSGGAPAADWAHSRLVSLAAGAEAAEAAAELAELTEAAARDDLEAASRLTQRRQRLTTVLAHQAQLAASAVQADELRTRLGLARLAAPLAPDVTRLLALRSQRPSLQSAWSRSLERFSVALDGCLGLTGDPAEVERLAQDRLAVTVPMLTVERELVAREHTLAAASAAAQAAEQRHVAIEGALAALRRRCSQLTESLAADEVTAAGLSTLRAAAAASRARADAAAQLPAAQALAVEADGLLQTGRAAALDARERWLDLRDRRLLGMAAELAAELVDGAGCSVCGGIDHPCPAQPQPDAVTEEAERLAHELSETAERGLDQLREAVRVASDVVTELRARAGDVSAKAAAMLEAELAGVETLTAGLPLRRAEFEQATAELDQSAVALVASEEALTKARTAVAGLVGSMDEQRAQVEAAREGAPSVADRERALRLLVEAAAAAVAAAAALEAADARLALLSDELEDSAAGAGFADLDAVASALLSADEVAAVERMLRDHDDAVAAVRSALDDPDLDVDLEMPLDLAAISAAAAKARDALSEAFAARADSVSRAAQAGTLTGRIERFEAELQPVRERYEQVAALAELASGGAGNRLRMSLTSYVLAARLEQVAARASVRLAHMTSGRFTLQHSDEVADARSRSGLGLAVQDVWTGTQRPTSSLSGGESFMTALSLALGLADVVAEEAGGRRIDTLFVDEGFGTLDEGALDRVMEVLDTLRDGGRLVGVVSHVEELQRRVPARLEVVRSETGSWLRAHHSPVAG